MGPPRTVNFSMGYPIDLYSLRGCQLLESVIVYADDNPDQHFDRPEPAP